VNKAPKANYGQQQADDSRSGFRVRVEVCLARTSNKSKN
jgi:hypothetical protein